MKISVVSVGKDKAGLFAAGVDEYVSRLKHYAPTALVELKPSGHSGEAAKTDEAKAIIERLQDRDVLVALDETGKQLSSRELASWVAQQQVSGLNLVFAIGGDEGLAEEVRRKARLTLSLSRLTLPHRLARLVLLEQLYRAFTIIKGEPYHK